MQLKASGSRRNRPATFAAADVELQYALDSLDGADNYAGWIVELIEPFLGAEVLEVGAGHGTITEALAKRGVRVVATDVSDRCVGVLRDRFGGMANVEVVGGDISVAADRGPYDTAILVNVLEHIEDDDAALRQLWGSLRVGGRLVLWVPAFQSLYSEFDRKVGHFRRYTTATLKARLTNAGFGLDQIYYTNAIGAIAWWVVARTLRLTPTQRSSVQLFDRVAVPMIKRVESRRRPPFGQSIFAVAVRPGIGVSPPGFDSTGQESSLGEAAKRPLPPHN